MLVPAKTPRDVIEKLNAETIKALRVPATQEKLTKVGAEPLIMSPEEFEARIRREITDNAALAKAAGIKPN
jgi:tripartite-type tricarboxylate transporter receptor subunit TctC